MAAKVRVHLPGPWIYFEGIIADLSGTAGFRTGAHTRMTVGWNLADDAGRSPIFSRVGFADKNNDSKWDVYRDDGRVLYEMDGWRAQAMFWAF